MPTTKKRSRAHHKTTIQRAVLEMAAIHAAAGVSPDRWLLDAVRSKAASEAPTTPPAPEPTLQRLVSDLRKAWGIR